jgi:hypothetical protein
MSKDLEFIAEPYEVVRTVGFKFSGLNPFQEYCEFLMRLEIVRYAGASVFSPVLWKVHPLLGALMESEMRLPTSLCRASVEDTMAVTLAYVNSKGKKASINGNLQGHALGEADSIPPRV